MIYVLSDIHGNKENFDSILEKISLQPEDSLYILGDVIDRYPYGIQLLQQIMRMGNAHMLLGNHEWMMMNALNITYTGFTLKCNGFKSTRETEEELFSLWYMNDGKVTHEAWNRLSGKEREELGAFLSRLPLGFDVSIDGRKYKLVHAAPVEKYRRFLMPGYANAVEYAVWDRRIFRHRFKTGCTLVFGHTPTLHMQDNNPLEIWDAGDRIGIDCGSGFPELSESFPVEGRLACLRLDDRQVFYSG